MWLIFFIVIKVKKKKVKSQEKLPGWPIARYALKTENMVLKKTLNAFNTDMQNFALILLKLLELQSPGVHRAHNA